MFHVISCGSSRTFFLFVAFLRISPTIFRLVDALVEPCSQATPTATDHAEIKEKMLKSGYTIADHSLEALTRDFLLLCTPCGCVGAIVAFEWLKNLGFT
jgi:hypothetical protein